MAFRSMLITGGAGFIGSNFVRLMAQEQPDAKITVLDALTYAGNMENISDPKAVREAMTGAEIVFNFAAETHVDRSIEEAASFIETDIQGTYNLLNHARELKVKRYVQISTDEVYGSSNGENFTEESPLNPGNPYSASKCGGDLMCLAYAQTHKVPVVITRSSCLLYTSPS